MKTQDISAHITSQSSLTPTILAWKIYLQDQGNSIHTIKAFVHDMQLLATFLPPERSLGSIATTDLNNFLDWLKTGRGVSCSPKSLARRITSIKAFFRWLNKKGVIIVDPAVRVIQKSVISPLPIVLTPDEIEKIIQIGEIYRNADKSDIRYLTLFFLLIHSGIKKNECLNLTINHLESDTPFGPMIFVRYSSPQFRYRERKIYLPKQWITIFDEYKNQYHIQEHLFPWSQRRLEYLLEDLSVEAGLIKHISFDMCRWTCALNDWNSGMEKEKIRQKLGVSKIQWREIAMKLKRHANED